jgi:hypothetical protein
MLVLVEGASDECALRVLAARLGRSLDGVEIAPLGGAGNAAAFLERVRGQRVAGLYDAGEARQFRRALGTDDLEAAGFFACDPDLEHELIRALGAEAVEEVVAEHGDLRRFRTFQAQPAQRAVPIERQLWRFIGTAAGRKLAYAGHLVEALDLERVPRPLELLLAHVAR